MIIPGWMMKGRLTAPPPDHYVPLSDAAMEAVEEAFARHHGKTGYLFKPGPARGGHQPRKPIPHIGDFRSLLHLLGYAQKTVNRRSRHYTPDFDVHGFRSTISTWANHNDFDSAHVDRVLGHKRTASGSEKDYNHSTLVAKRRQILDAWGAFCTTPYDASADQHADNVIAFPKAVRVKRRSA